MSANTQHLSLGIDMLADLPAKAMLALVTKHRETKRFFEQAQHTVQNFPALFLLFEDMDIDIRFDPDLKLISTNFAGDGPNLGKIWGELRRHGFKCQTRPKKGDTQFSGWFQREGYATISIYFTSTLCRRVKIGTKTVEQDIYETICGDSLEVTAPAEPAALTVVNGDLDDDIPF